MRTNDGGAVLARLRNEIAIMSYLAGESAMRNDASHAAGLCLLGRA